MLFATPQEAEAAFYEAFVKRDLEGMMAVWADDDEVYCVHPRGPRVTGVAQVRESWRQVFAGGVLRSDTDRGQCSQQATDKDLVHRELRMSDAPRVVRP